jgi:UPF0755 protein
VFSFNNQERIENLAGRIGSQIEPDSLSIDFFKDLFLKENGFNENNIIVCIPTPMKSIGIRALISSEIK